MGHCEQGYCERGAPIKAVPADASDPIGVAAEFLATQNGAVDKILAVHKPAPLGRRCVVCSVGQHGSHTWPCALAAIANRVTASWTAQGIPVAGR